MGGTTQRSVVSAKSPCFPGVSLYDLESLVHRVIREELARQRHRKRYSPCPAMRALRRARQFALGENPFSSRARELRERPRVFRIWLAGRWRIVYEVDDDLKMVLILRVRLKENINHASL